MTEHKDRPDPQCTPGGEQNDAKPPDSIAVEDPEPLPVPEPICPAVSPFGNAASSAEVMRGFSVILFSFL